MSVVGDTRSFLNPLLPRSDSFLGHIKTRPPLPKQSKFSSPPNTPLQLLTPSPTKASMDDFRTLVKTFELLSSRPHRERAHAACLNLATTSRNALDDPQLVRRIREFVDEHLAPAKVENLGTELAGRQEFLQRCLERVLGMVEAKARGAEGMGVQGRQVQGSEGQGPARSAFAVPPTPLFTPPVLGQGGAGGGKNLFHALRTADHQSPTTAMTYPSPTTAFSSYMSPYPQTLPPAANNNPGASQMERTYNWAGEHAVRRLLALDDGDEMADLRRVRKKKKLSVREMRDEMACQRAGEVFGGVWMAAEWGGRGAPEESRAYG